MEGQAARREYDVPKMAVEKLHKVPAVFDKLNSEIMKLGEELGMLYDVIKPIQGEETENKMADDREGAFGSDSSEVVRTLDDFAERLGVIRRRLIEQRSRIEL